MKSFIFPFLLFSALIFISCSSAVTEEDQLASDENMNDHIQIDTLVINEIQPPVVDNEKTPNVNPVREPAKVLWETVYIVQIGAFTTSSKAESFAKDAVGTLKLQPSVSFNDRVGYFVVQLPAYRTIQEARKMRDLLRNQGDFQDAFILTVRRTVSN